MATRNQLLGSGVVPEEEKAEVSVNTFSPMFVYHPTAEDEKGFPVGVKATTQAQFDELVKFGYKDNPGKVKKLPGHEHLFEGEEESEF
jgi:hypothetical protein